MIALCILGALPLAALLILAIACYHDALLLFTFGFIALVYAIVFACTAYLAIRTRPKTGV